jgi:phosphatidylcholine synthase
MPWFAAFAVHVLTASGVALGLAALMVATQQRWTLMFWLLAAALLVDGIDGPIARKVRVAEVLPRWSGDVLDLVVDFITYVFVPAYAIVTSGLVPDLLALPIGIVIVITGAIYFADRDMKTADQFFQGFPALWNAVVFYLFLLKPAPWLSAMAIMALAVLTFVPFKFLHPFRVVRLRSITLAAVVAWSALGVAALLYNLDPGPWITGGLVVVGLYFVVVGLADQWI